MTAREEFLRLVCAYSPVLYMMLVFVTTLAVMNVIAMSLAEQSEGAFAVSLMVFAFLGVTGGGIVVLLWRCNQTHPGPPPGLDPEE